VRSHDALETLAVDVAETFEPSFAEARVARALSPWFASDAPPLTTTHAPLAAGTFRRMVALDASYLDALPAWWQANQHEAVVRVTRNFSVGPFALVADATWRAPAWLQRAPMELLCWRHLTDWSLLLLQPLRKPRAGPFYFRRGHGALDELVVRFRSDLVTETLAANGTLGA
jgi:hypothetical protein